MMDEMDMDWLDGRYPLRWEERLELSARAAHAEIKELARQKREEQFRPPPKSYEEHLRDHLRDLMQLVPLGQSVGINAFAQQSGPRYQSELQNAPFSGWGLGNAMANAFHAARTSQ